MGGMTLVSSPGTGTCMAWVSGLPDMMRSKKRTTTTIVFYDNCNHKYSAEKRRVLSPRNKNDIIIHKEKHTM